MEACNSSKQQMTRTNTEPGEAAAVGDLALCAAVM